MIHAMSLIAASIFLRDAAEVDDALRRAVTAVSDGAGLVEWRVDALAETEAGRNVIAVLVQQSPAPCIVTCRSVSEGGSFTGDLVDYAQVLESVAAGPLPRYLDVELAAWLGEGRVREVVAQAVVQAQPDGDMGVLLSSHAVEGRPADLLQRVEVMSGQADAAVIKLVWTARSIRDNLEAIDLLSERRKPMIALCMGPLGLMSRVLAPKYGGLLTFAAQTSSSSTAPGQPTIHELRDCYRFDQIGRETQLLGVVGWPIGHSRSPQLHNAGFQETGFDGVLIPLPVPPEYEHFKASMSALVDHPHLGFRGASVTLPHKEHLIRFVEESGGRVEEQAARVGAANTLIVGAAGALVCLNTDVPAVVDALCSGMGIEQAELRGRRVVVFGAGGVARAAVGGLCMAGARVVVINRTHQRAQDLVEDLRQRLALDEEVLAVGAAEQLTGQDHQIFINCTSVGMAGGPDPAGSPLPENLPLDDGSTVFDTVYTPVRTPLMTDAAARGARVIPGTEMFLRQAAMQFEAWTGQEAPPSVFREAL
jgi:3-dehydroquinate dehydratase/shikimate dehydrogenase